MNQEGHVTRAAGWWLWTWAEGALRLPSLCPKNSHEEPAAACLPACLQQHWGRGGLGFPLAMAILPLSLALSDLKAFTSWCVGSGKRLCPTEEKHLPCLSLQAGRISSWLLQNCCSLGQKHQPSSKSGCHNPGLWGSAPAETWQGWVLGTARTGLVARRCYWGSGTLCTPGRGSYLADSREAVDQHGKEKSMFPWMPP